MRKTEDVAVKAPPNKALPLPASNCAPLDGIFSPMTGAAGRSS